MLKSLLNAYYVCDFKSGILGETEQERGKTNTEGLSLWSIPSSRGDKINGTIISQGRI